MRFIMTCAGTAGHINPALAIAGRLRELMPDAEFLFIGSGREMENRLIPMAGFRIENIRSTGFERGFGFRQVKSHCVMVKNLISGSRQAKRLIQEFKPNAVIGTGGYVCYPVIKNAARMKIPTFIHESNAVPGLTTRLLDGCADKIMVAFPNMESAYKHPERVLFTGTPIRGGFSGLTKENAKEKLGLGGKRVVVSFWGSLGASKMNEATADFIAKNQKERCFYHIHATGGGDEGLEAMRSLLRERGVDPDKLKNTDMRSYIDDMPLVMTASDMVMCRSGASTLGEITAIGKPSVLVPSPYVTDNHQEKNAMRLEKTGGSVMIKECDCTGGRLFETVHDIVTDKERLDKMAEAVMAVGVPNSADIIADIILSLC